jgi:hypothetical protein
VLLTTKNNLYLKTHYAICCVVSSYTAGVGTHDCRAGQIQVGSLTQKEEETLCRHSVASCTSLTTSKLRHRILNFKKSDVNIIFCKLSRLNIDTFNSKSPKMVILTLTPADRYPLNTCSGENPRPTRKLADQLVTTAMEVAIGRPDWNR